MNLAFAPTTFTTGCRPIVLVTTPPHPASNARRMLLSDSVGGADESRNGFSKRMPVKVVDRSGAMRPPPRRDDEGGKTPRIVLSGRGRHPLPATPAKDGGGDGSHEHPRHQREPDPERHLREEPDERQRLHGAHGREVRRQGVVVRAPLADDR